MVIKKRCHARVGLLGNPSDGYFGKTVSLSLANFYAEVTLSPADDISVQPHPVHDLTHYRSLKELVRSAMLSFASIFLRCVASGNV